MIKSISKLILAVLLLIMLFAVALLCVLRFQPQLLVKQAPNYSDFRIDAPDLALTLHPFSVQSEQMTVSSVSNSQTIASLAAVAIRVDLPALWRGDAMALKAEMNSLDVYLDNIPASSSTETASTATEPGLPQRLDLAPLFAVEKVRVDTLRVHQGGAVQHQIKLLLQAEDEVNQQHVAVQWQGGDKSLDLKALLAYEESAQQRKLNVDIKTLDLTPVLANNVNADSDAQSQAEAAGEAGDADALDKAENTVEAALDWRWLAMLDRWQLALNIALVDLGDTQLSDLSTALSISNKTLEINNISMTPKLNHDDTAIALPLALKGQLEVLGWETVSVDLRLDSQLLIAEQQLALAGDLNVNGMAGNNASLSVKAIDNEIIRALAGGSFAAVKPYLPLSLDANIKTDTYSVDVEKLILSAGSSDLRGALSVALNKAAITAKGQLHANKLYLAQKAETEAETEADKSADAQDSQTTDAEGETETGNEKLIPSEAIDWQWLSNSEIDLAVTVDQLWLNKAQFSDFTTKLSAENGQLALAPFKASFGGGGFDGNLSLKELATPADEGVRLALDFKTSGVQLAAFGFIPQEQLSGGELDIDLSLSGQGISAADIAASLEGAAITTVQKATLMNDTVELVGSDLLMETLNKINPFAKSDPTTELVCALVWFEANDGVLNIQAPLLMETSKMRIVGKGDIDLNDESLDIGITPEAKGGISLNVGSLVKFLKVGGTLASPSPGVDAGGLLKSGAAIGATLSTGGLSIVAESLVKQVANSGNACESAWTKYRTSHAQAEPALTRTGDDKPAGE